MQARCLAAAVLLLSLPCHAQDNCSAIRAGIEAKVRGSGTHNFTLSTVAADARVPGKVVGSCDRGAKKIVYLQGAASSPAVHDMPRTPERIITECRDGSVSADGRCPK